MSFRPRLPLLASRCPIDINGVRVDMLKQCFFGEAVLGPCLFGLTSTFDNVMTIGYSYT